jgi:hypothetical protein
MSPEVVTRSRGSPKLLYAAVMFLFLSLLTTATIWKNVWNQVETSLRKEGAHPCWNAAELRARGTLVAEVSIAPAEFEYKGCHFRFGEAWLEEAAERDYCLVWFPCWRRLGHYYLCFRLAEGADVAWENGLGFALEDEFSGFVGRSSSGEQVFYRTMDAVDWSQRRMSLLSSGEDGPRPKNITITLHPTR